MSRSTFQKTAEIGLTGQQSSSTPENWDADRGELLRFFTSHGFDRQDEMEIKFKSKIVVPAQTYPHSTLPCCTQT